METGCGSKGVETIGHDTLTSGGYLRGLLAALKVLFSTL